MSKKILITGGAGFIGSALIRRIINNTNYSIVNIDKLTYAGNLASLNEVANNPRYNFMRVDICDKNKISAVFNEFKPDIVMHLAAESHVDRSIDCADNFIQTNIVGTYVLLEQARIYWSSLQDDKKSCFRFHHVSTDEVYGDSVNESDLFSEQTSYAPSSPYAASKASSDHLVRAWWRTFGLPIIITNCSNNYGPYQFPEKLIPLIILNALAGKKLPVYGDGTQVRDWLFVDDHAHALLHCALNGRIGETYNIGGQNQMQNIDVVKKICRILDRLKPVKKSKYEDLIIFVKDRAGHDLRYGINASKINKELGWKPKQIFDTGIEKTAIWYLNNQQWCKNVHDNGYQTQKLGSVE